MKKWEYKIKDLWQIEKDPYRNREFNDLINYPPPTEIINEGMLKIQGEKGWELVTIAKNGFRSRLCA
jgi:hypothetical protein